MDEQRRTSDFGRSQGQAQSRPTQVGQQEQGQKERGGSGKQGEQGTAENLRNMGRKLEHSGPAQALREEGQEIGGEVKHYVQDAARSGIGQVTERLHHVSDALHRAADTLKSDEEPTTGRYADQAAQQIDRLCNYIDKQEPADLLNQANKFARHQPMVFVGGALVVGLMLSRFLRSTSPEDSSEQQDTSRHSSDQGFGPQSRQPSTVGTGMGQSQGSDVGIGMPRTGGGMPGPTTSRPLTDTPRPGTSGPGRPGGGV